MDAKIELILLKLIAWLRMFSICWWRKNVIIILLRLELFLITLFVLVNEINSLFISFYILIIATIIVRGSSLGLALLVSISRSHNSSTCSLVWNIIFGDNNHKFIHSFII